MKILKDIDAIFSLLGVKSKNLLKKVEEALSRLRTVPYIPYPVSFSTVDIFPLYVNEEREYEILLGRKHDQTTWQLCGGFRDPKETNEEAASREFEEEASHKIPPVRFTYLFSKFIDDRRYRNSCHKITTSLFYLQLAKEDIPYLKGGDDIAEVKLWNLNELLIEPNEIIRPVHQELFSQCIAAVFNNGFRLAVPRVPEK